MRVDNDDQLISMESVSQLRITEPMHVFHSQLTDMRHEVFGPVVLHVEHRARGGARGVPLWCVALGAWLWAPRANKWSMNPCQT